LNNTITEFFERAARSCAYKAEEFVREELREKEITRILIEEYLDNGVETHVKERLATLLEERIRDIIYELFEIERSEDASCETNDVIKNGLFGIQRAMDGLEGHLYQRRSLAHHREVEGRDPPKGTGLHGEQY
jgi:hypothetical protein